MNDTTLTVAGFFYKISKGLAIDEADAGAYVLCLDEVRANSLPENKNKQVPFIYQWVIENCCNGCHKILETNDPDLTQKGIPKLEVAQ